MVEEFEKDDARKEKEEVSREGYSATEQSNYSKGNQPTSQGRPQRPRIPVSYTHLTLPTNREV